MIENFGWLIQGKLPGSGDLIHHVEFAEHREQGVRAIVSLTEFSLLREKLLLHQLHPLGFVYHHIHVIDESAPSQEQVDEFIGFVNDMLNQERVVLVHCRGGYGRTGTMLACYLVSRGWEAEKAIAEVHARRPGSIAPLAQQECIVEYAERVQRGKFH